MFNWLVNDDDIGSRNRRASPVCKVVFLGGVSLLLTTRDCIRVTHMWTNQEVTPLHGQL